MQKLKEEIKKKIMEVGKQKFKAIGFDNTSMKEIASDAGISTGNIYRYFLTKKHLLDEILNELETDIDAMLEEISTHYQQEGLQESFKKLTDGTIALAKKRGDTLKIMFNSPQESLFLNFKNRILHTLMDKMVDLFSQQRDYVENKVLHEAIARAAFEGFTYLVRENLNEVDTLRQNLTQYGNLLLKGLS